MKTPLMNPPQKLTARLALPLFLGVIALVCMTRDASAALSNTFLWTNGANSTASGAAASSNNYATNPGSLQPQGMAGFSMTGGTNAFVYSNNYSQSSAQTFNFGATNAYVFGLTVTGYTNDVIFTNLGTYRLDTAGLVATNSKSEVGKAAGTLYIYNTATSQSGGNMTLAGNMGVYLAYFGGHSSTARTFTQNLGSLSVSNFQVNAMSTTTIGSGNAATITFQGTGTTTLIGDLTVANKSAGGTNNAGAMIVSSGVVNLFSTNAANIGANGWNSGLVITNSGSVFVRGQNSLGVQAYNIKIGTTTGNTTRFGVFDQNEWATNLGSAVTLTNNFSILNASGASATNIFQSVAGKTLTLSGIISSTNSAGTLLFLNGTTVLAGSNTFSNAVVISNSTLVLSNATALGSTNAVTVADAGILDLGGFANTPLSTLALNSGSVTNGSVAATTGYALSNASGSANVSAVLAGSGALTKSGAGTYVLASNNTYSGATTISNGALVFGVSNAIATGNTVTVGGGATSGTLDLGGFTNTLDSVVISNGVIANGTIIASTLFRATNAGGTISASIAGAGGFSNNVTGTTLLSGSNNFTGLVRVEGGTLQLGNTWALGSNGAGHDTVGTQLRGGILDLNGQTNINETLLFASPDSYVTNSSTNTATWSGSIFLSNSTVNFNVGSGRDIVVTGSITNGSQSRILYKNGDGVLTFSNANTNQGNVNVNAGTLRMGNGLALGRSDTTNNLAVSNGATLDVNGYTAASVRALSIAGTGVGGNGAIYNSSSSAATLSNGITLTNNASVGSVGNLTLSGVIGGSGFGVTKVGAGTLTLGGVNTYTGGTTISNGGLAISSSNNVAGGSITVAGTSPNTAKLISTVSSGTSNAPASLALGGVTMSGNAVLSLANVYTKFDLNSLSLSGSSNQLGIVNSGWEVGVDGATNTFTLLSSVGNITGGNTMSLLFGNTTVAIDGSTVVGRNNYQFIYTNNNTYQLNVWGGAFDLLWSGGESALWNTNATNWDQAGGATGIAFAEGDNVTFTGLGATNITVDAGPVSAGTMVVSNNTGALTLSGSNVTATLSVGSGGNLIVEGTLTPRGSATVDGGTLQIGSGGTSGALGNTNAINLANSGSFIINLSTNNTLSNQVTGAGSLSKLGSGTTTLSAANTYNGGTLVSAGELAGSTTSLQGAITNNAKVTLSQSTNGTYAGTMSGTGALTKLGSGTVTLSGNNTYTGKTTVSAGGLSMGAASGTNIAGDILINGGLLNYATSVNNQIASTSDVEMSSGTFSVGGRDQGLASLTMSGGSLTIGSGYLTNTDASSLTGGRITMSSSSGGRLDFSNNLTLGGVTLVYSNAATNTLHGLRMLTASTVTYSSNNAPGGAVFSNALTGIGRFSLQTNAVTFDIQDSTATNTEVTMGWNIDSTSSSGRLVKTGDGAMLLSQSNGYSGGTTLAGGTLRVGNDNGLGSGALTLSNGTLASSGSAARTFANSTTIAGDITFGDSVGTGSLTFSSTAANNLGGGMRTLTTAVDTSIAGALTNGGITKAGSGTLTLSGANTYSDGTLVSSGSLVGSTTSLQGAITNNATTTFSQTTNGTYAGAMSGSGVLTKSSSGTVTLSGANTYNGGTVVSAGELVGSTTSLQGAITNNATTTFSQTTNGTYAGTMSGTGVLTKSGAGTVTLSGANNYSGGTLVSAGALAGDTTSLQGAITNNATTTFSQATNGTYAGTMSGSGALTKSGNGTLTLSASNTYSGSTTVSGGSLAYGVSNAIATGNTVFISGGTLDLGGYTNTLSLLRFNGGQLTNGTLTSSGNIASTNSANTTNTISATLAGGSATNVTFIGITNNATGGVTILSGSNSYTGITEINSGTLALGNNYALGAVGAMSTGGVGGNHTQLRGGHLDLNGMTGVVETLVMSNSGSYVTNSASNTATWAGGITMYISASNNFNVGTNGAINITGLIRGSGSRVMQKNGDGVLILSGANTNQGTINVNAGTLRMGSAGALGDSSATNAVNVLSGATLDVNGYTVNNPGTSGANRTLSIAGTGVGGNGAIYNSSSTAATLSNGVTLSTNASVGSVGNLTLSGVIGGSGFGVTKVGAGTLTLSGVNTYTGGTTISNGGLAISSSNNVAGGSVTVAGSSSNTAKLISTVASGTLNAPASLSLGGLTMSGNAVLSLANVYTKFDLNSLALSGSSNQLAIVNSGWEAGDDGATNTFTLLSSAGNISGGNTMSLLFGNTTVAIDGSTVLGRNNYQFIYTNNNAYQLNVWGGAFDLVWNGIENSSWNTNSTNWNQAGDPENIAFVSSDNVTFTGLGATNITVDAGPVTAGTMVVSNNTGALTLSGSNVTATLTVGSGGNLIVDGILTPRGNATVDGGTLQIGNGGATGSLGNTNTIDLANSGSLIVNLSTNSTLSNKVTGAGSLTKLGSGTTVLAVSNSYTGQTIVGVGTLQVGSAAAGAAVASAGTGSIVVSNAATLAFYRSNIYTNANDISGAGSVSQLGTNSLELAGNNTFSGGLYLNTNANGTVWGSSNANFGSGTIYAVSSNSSVGLSKLGGTSASMTITNRMSTSLSGNSTDVLAFNVGRSNTYTITLDGFITGAGGLKITSSAVTNGSGASGTGTGTLYVNNATNDYAGGTELGNGRISISAGSALGTGNILFSSTNLGSTILQVTGDTTLSQNFTLGASAANSTALAVVETTNNTATTISGVISNRTSTSIGALVKTGAGTLILSGANTYTGGTVVSAGQLAYGADNVLANSGAVTVSNATFNIGSYSDTVGAVTVTNGGRITGTTGILTGSSYASGVDGATNTISANLAGSGGLTLTGNTNTTVLSGSNSYSGDTALNNTTSTNMRLRVNSTNALSSNSSLLGSTSAGRTPTLELAAAGNYKMQNFKGGNMIFLATNGDATISFTNTSVTNEMTAGDKSFYATNVNVSLAGALDVSATTADKEFRFYGDGDYTFDGSILTTNNTFTSSLVAGTTGTVTLNASNNYNGTTMVNSNATLLLGNDYALGTTNSGTTVLSGGALDLGGRTVSGEMLLTEGAGVSSGGAIKNSSASAASFSGAVTLTAATTIATTNGNITLSGAIGQDTGSRNLTKTGASTLTLSGTSANTYLGRTTVSGGVLELNKTAGVNAIAGAVTVGSGAKLLLSANNQVANTSAITLSGGTIQRASGVSEVFGDLDLTAASFLNFGTGDTGTLSFGTYTPSALLTINNFMPGNTLTFGSDLTSTINNTSFFSFSGDFTSSYSGSTFTITAIPEPSTYVAAVGLLGLMLWPSRRRLLKDAKSILGLRAPARDRLQAQGKA